MHPNLRISNWVILIPLPAPKERSGPCCCKVAIMFIFFSYSLPYFCFVLLIRAFVWTTIGTHHGLEQSHSISYLLCPAFNATTSSFLAANAPNWRYQAGVHPNDHLTGPINWGISEHVFADVRHIWIVAICSGCPQHTLAWFGWRSLRHWRDARRFGWTWKGAKVISFESPSSYMWSNYGKWISLVSVFLFPL